MSEPTDPMRLAAAIRDRMDELGLSQERAAERSRQLADRSRDNPAPAQPGVSTRTWSKLATGSQPHPRTYTLLMVDATLRWPKGTARAILHGGPLPEGPPFLASDEDDEVTQAVGRRDRAELRREMADLRADLAALRADLAALEEVVVRLAKGRVDR